jgi:hypothetical protein
MATVREIPCPICVNRKKHENNFETPTEPKNGQAPFSPGGAQTFLFGLFKKDDTKAENRLKPVKELFDSGKCPTCGGREVIEDKTDRTPQIEAAVAEAQAAQQQITDLEAQIGQTGGNQHVLVVGDAMLEVGLGYNDSPSYAVVQDGSLGTSVSMEEKAPVDVGEPVNAVVGTNPLATPGGHYVIKCSNKFTVRAGAQGIELSTEGPLVIRAGQTQFIAPEVTIGSSVGAVAIEGQSLSINGGKSCQINAGSEGSGQITMGGTVNCKANLIAQGGAHVEGDVSCTSMTMPGIYERSEHASQDQQTSGAPGWGNKCAEQGTKDFLRVHQMRTQDPSGLELTPRGKQDVSADQKNLLKKSQEIEQEPTGYIVPNTQIELLIPSMPCNGSGPVTNAVLIGTIRGPLPKGVELRNLPHHHELGDQVHAHENYVPNINKVRSTKEMRQAAKIKQAPGRALGNFAAVNATADKGGFGAATKGILGKLIG